MFLQRCALMLCWIYNCTSDAQFTRLTAGFLQITLSLQESWKINVYLVWFAATEIDLCFYYVYLEVSAVVWSLWSLQEETEGEEGDEERREHHNCCHPTPSDEIAPHLKTITRIHLHLPIYTTESFHAWGQLTLVVLQFCPKKV